MFTPYLSDLQYLDQVVNIHIAEEFAFGVVKVTIAISWKTEAGILKICEIIINTINLVGIPKIRIKELVDSQISDLIKKGEI